MNQYPVYIDPSQMYGQQPRYAPMNVNPYQNNPNFYANAQQPGLQTQAAPQNQQNPNNTHLPNAAASPNVNNSNNPNTIVSPNGGVAQPQTNSSAWNPSAATFVPQTTNNNSNVNNAMNANAMNNNAQTQHHPIQPQQPGHNNDAINTVSTGFMFNPSNNNAALILKEKLQRRLARDIEDFQNNLTKYTNFNAMPRKGNLEIWHFNVWPTDGVYKDFCINGKISFPQEYPQKPPTVEVSVGIPHPNVKSISSKHWVHLDILSSSKWKQSHSILQIFDELISVFDNTKMSDINNEDYDLVNTSQDKLKSFRCMWTGHTALQPWPAKGQPLPHSRKQIDRLRANYPLNIENHEYQWRYCRIKQISASFGKVYYEAKVVSSILGPNNLTTIQIGWALPPDDNPALGEEFEYVVLGNRYRMNHICGMIIHKRPFEISHNHDIQSGFGNINDNIACAADFEKKMISFYINGECVGHMEFPTSFIESDKPLVPVVGLSLACVVLNFRQLKYPIDELSQSYLSVQEYLQIDRSDWIWETGSLVDWNVLFTYGLPLEMGDGIQANNHNSNNDNDKEEDHDKFRKIVLDIFHYLTFADLSRCREVCKIWNEVINCAYFVARSKLRCYYSDKSYDDKQLTSTNTKSNDDAIIGLMLSLKKEKKSKTVNVNLLSYSNDVISYNVWNKMNVHIDSKHFEYTHFLPMVINKEHGKRASKLISICIAQMIEKPGFRAGYGLDVMTCLLNSVIESLHKELFVRKNKLNNSQKLNIIREKVNLWSHLVHILLHLCNEFHAIEEIVDQRLEALSSKNSQAKKVFAETMNLGQIIMYLLISGNHTWHTIRRLWVEERFARDCKEMISNDANMLDVLQNSELSEKDRLDAMYNGSTQSRSLTRLLIAFITLDESTHSKVDNKENKKKLTLSEKYKLFNLRYGSPHPQWVFDLEEKCDEMLNSKTWEDYFKGIFVVAPKAPTLSGLLMRCFVQGGKQGYYKITNEVLLQNKPSQNSGSNRGNRSPRNRNRNDNMQNNRQSPQRNDNQNNRQSPQRNEQIDRRNMQSNKPRIVNDGGRGGGRGGQNRSFRDNFGRGAPRGGGRGGGGGGARNERGTVQPNTGSRFQNLGVRDNMSRTSPSYNNNRNDNYGGRGGGGGWRGGGRDNNRGGGGGWRGGGGRDNYRGRGGGRGGRGRGRGRGRGGDNFQDPRFNPNRDVSQYTAMKYDSKSINTFTDLPAWIQRGCKKSKMLDKLTPKQRLILSDFCLGNDSLIVNDDTLESNLLIIIGSLYRLYTKRAPAHVILICVDHLHVLNMCAHIEAVGEFVPDLQVHPQMRGSPYVPFRSLREKRNIFVCSPGKAINMVERGGNDLSENLVTVSVMDGDSLLVGNLFEKMKQAFTYIPQGINVNFVSNSLCVKMKENIGKLVNLSSDLLTKKHMCNSYGNLKHWFIYCPKRGIRTQMLGELCKVNPYSQGIVFCSGLSQSKIISESIRNEYKSIVLESENVALANEAINKFNTGECSYLIVHEYSPIHMLYKCNVKNCRILINYDLRTSNSYLKRACSNCHTKKSIHVISLIDEEQTKIYEDVETNCNVQLIELPKNVAQTLTDDNNNNDEGNDDNNNDKQ